MKFTFLKNFLLLVSNLYNAPFVRYPPICGMYTTRRILRLMSIAVSPITGGASGPYDTPPNRYRTIIGRYPIIRIN